MAKFSLRLELAWQRSAAPRDHFRLSFMMMSAGKETYTALLSAAATGNDLFKMVAE
jgi:hypothetical protein